MVSKGHGQRDSKMKNGMAVGPSGLVLEIVKAAGTQFIVERYSSRMGTSTIVSCCKRNRVALERGNYRGLRLTDWILKITERVDKTTGGHFMLHGVSCQDLKLQTLILF